MSKEYDLGRVVGRDATINGQNAIELIGGNNIDIQQDGSTVTVSLDGELDNPHFNDKDNPHEVTASQVGAVPVERTINGQSLTDDITLTPSDIDAVPINRKINNKSLNEDITLTSDDVDAVPMSRTVNGHSLDENITLTSSDVGAAPTERTVNGKPLSENISLSASDVNAVPVNRTVNGKPLTDNISLNASDVGAAPTSHGTHVTYGTTSPKMDGIAGTGSSSSVSRADHVHPHDTSKQDRLTGTENQYVGFDKDGNAVAKLMDYSLFGFQIDPDESDPSKNIKYLCQNASYDPAYMDYEKDEFNYGDWGDAWFIKKLKVVALKKDGTVYRELRHDKYSTDFNGYSSSDYIKDTYNDGYNIMVGIPTVWIKLGSSGLSKPVFYFSDVKLDEEFHAYAHTNANGEVVPYIYMAAYNGWKDDDGNLRSLSGKDPTGKQNYTEQIAAARANNPTGKNMWDIDILADRQLINLLLLLIGKSTNTQEVFGNGNMNGYTNPAEGSYSQGVLPTGTMDNKGLFWGSNADNLGVKVFGIEHWWGNLCNYIQGMILQDGKLLIKMTRGTQDGSTVDDYNTTGEGYIDMNTIKNGWIKSMRASIYGLLPQNTGASATTYFADYVRMLSTSGVRLPLVGGTTSSQSQSGAFDLDLGATISNSNKPSRVSCKPE